MKLGDNRYIDLKMEFIISDTTNVSYIEPVPDEVKNERWVHYLIN